MQHKDYLYVYKYARDLYFCGNIYFFMKELEIEFSSGGSSIGGFVFKQLLRSNVCYLYGVNDGSHYEVFLRREQKEGEMVLGGNKIILEAKVLYPKDEAFGVWAWSYVNLKNALQKFHFLNSQYLGEKVDNKVRMDFRFRVDVVEFLREKDNMSGYLECLVLREMGKV